MPASICRQTGYIIYFIYNYNEYFICTLLLLEQIVMLDVPRQQRFDGNGRHEE